MKRREDNRLFIISLKEFLYDHGVRFTDMLGLSLEELCNLIKSKYKVEYICYLKSPEVEHSQRKKSIGIIITNEEYIKIYGELEKVAAQIRKIRLEYIGMKEVVK